MAPEIGIVIALLSTAVKQDGWLLLAFQWPLEHAGNTDTPVPPCSLMPGTRTRYRAWYDATAFWEPGKASTSGSKKFWFYSSTVLYLTPFTRTAHGQYNLRDHKSMIAHYFVGFIMLLMFLQKTCGLGTLLLYDELKIETFICAANFLVYYVSFSLSLVMLVRPKETMDLLNSWPLILHCLKQPIPTQYDDLSEAFKLIALLTVTQGVALSAAMCSLIFSTLPTCYFPVAERLGFIPQGLLPRFAWQLLFFPPEYATYIPPMLSAPLALSMLLILIGVFRTYSYRLR